MRHTRGAFTQSFVKLQLAPRARRLAHVERALFGGGGDRIAAEAEPGQTRQLKHLRRVLQIFDEGRSLATYATRQGSEVVRAQSDEFELGTKRQRVRERGEAVAGQHQLLQLAARP